jgi:uncharacterized protein YukJ
MNQGDPPGPHRAEDGSWQDGAVICQQPAGTISIWQIKFNTQSLNTGSSGLPRDPGADLEQAIALKPAGLDAS